MSNCPFCKDIINRRLVLDRVYSYWHNISLEFILGVRTCETHEWCKTKKTTGAKQRNSSQVLTPRKSHHLLAPWNTTWHCFYPINQLSVKRQKFHTDDVNHCLHNKSRSHGRSKCKFVWFYVSPSRLWQSFVFYCVRVPVKLRCFL